MRSDFEIWKPIEGYEGLYEVSNWGEVRSLNYMKTGKIQLLKLHKDTKGYLRTGLNKNGENNTHKIHRLVAEAFIPNPNNLPQVNHINENKTDNYWRNLEWVSNIDNANHGTRNKRLSKPVVQYTKDGKLLQVYESIRLAEKITGISNQVISCCCKGNPHHSTAGGYIWRYA